MVQLLHVLTLRHRNGNEPHFGPEERETSHHCEAALNPQFPDARGKQKFVEVVQALVTLCTAKSGDDNVAVMVALSDMDIKLYICQNGGRTFESVKGHLEAAWKILTTLYSVRTSTPDPHNPITPRVSDRLELSAKLLDLSYLFVAEKALSRVKKRLPFLQTLRSKLFDDQSPSTNDFQKNLVKTFLGVALSATKVAQTGLKNLSQRQDWQDFRTCTLLLYNITASLDYSENTEAMEGLQVMAKEAGKDYIYPSLFISSDP